MEAKRKVGAICPISDGDCGGGEGVEGRRGGAGAVRGQRAEGF